MTGQDLQTFSDACARLFGAGLHPGVFIDRSFRFLRSLVSCELVVYGNLSVAERQLEIAADRPHSSFAPAMSAFGGLMSKYPLFCWDPSLNDGKPFWRGDFYTARQFRNLDIYCEVYRPLDLDNHCALPVSIGSGSILFYGIERRGGCDFSQRDLALLKAAQAPLSSAHALARTLASSPHHDICPNRLRAAGLTPREAETLLWIARGKSNAEIALLMNIRIDTVKGYVTSIFNKSGAGNRLSAILWAQELCLSIDRDPSPAHGLVRIAPRRPSPPEVG